MKYLITPSAEDVSRAEAVRRGCNGVKKIGD
jgi:hypothetical protein